MLLPLKQGLKHIGVVSEVMDLTCCYATSIKTRIETVSLTSGSATRRPVVMLLPLKQGLKPSNETIPETGGGVVMLLPLKQGLKQIKGEKMRRR